MSSAWSRVRLGEVLRRSAETTELAADREYREITVRLWGKGVTERGRLLGAEIAGSRRFVARAGQFIVSRIDARNGAMGIVPRALDGAVVTNDFPLFDAARERLAPEFLGWLSKTAGFVDLCTRASEGTTNRVRLKEQRFLALDIPLPLLAEQRRLVDYIEALAANVRKARVHAEQQEASFRALLDGHFAQVSQGAPWHPLREVAPIVRRPIVLDATGKYAELGIRSFGKGTFHKPAIDGLVVGEKRLFSIEPGDLLFSNVFAWEGAIAVARPEDAGRVGSHRFITCVPRPGVARADFLCHYFLTERGLADIQASSPGGAGRNRTLSLEGLGALSVPLPSFAAQTSFADVLALVAAARDARKEASAAMAAFIPSVIERAFACQR